MKLFIISLLFILKFSGSALAAKTLTIDDLLQSSFRHSPKIKSALAKIESAQGGYQSALSPFDINIKNETSARLSGFYTGDYTDTKISKRLQPFNSEISLGYRISDGTFPIYEDYNSTNGDGEISLNVALSLLRNRDIDKDRFNLFKNKVNLDQASVDYLITKIYVQQNAFKYYLNWVTAGLKQKAYKSLLLDAQERQKALKAREKRGDIPKIQIIENEQIIFQRKEVLQRSRNEFENAKNDLSLFWRDKNGKSLLVKDEQLPKKFPIIKGDYMSITQIDIDNFISQRPELKAIENEILIKQKEKQLGENNLLPKVDLNLYGAEDFGFGDNGSSTREGFESKAMVNFSLDLQRNLGKGQIQKAKADLKSLEYEKQLMIDKLKASLGNIINNINNSKKIVSLSEQEISLANKMVKAERDLLKNGQSNFFLINAREIAIANARVKNIEAKKIYSNAVANYLIATLDFESIGIVK